MDDNDFQSFCYSGVHFGAAGSNEAYACGIFGIARLSLTTNTWTIINNGIPSGATCTAMGVDQLTTGTLYAGTSSGVYKTTDGGNNWTLLFTDAGSYVSIIVDPTNSQNVFLSAGFGAGGFSMRSTDAGNSWMQMRAEGQMAIHPTSPNILYTIGPNSLAASYDSGLTWAVTTTPYYYQQDLTVTPSGVVVISTFGSSVVAFTPN